MDVMGSNRLVNNKLWHLLCSALLWRSGYGMEREVQSSSTLYLGRVWTLDPRGLGEDAELN
jgi:hypothetical protein